LAGVVRSEMRKLNLHLYHVISQKQHNLASHGVVSMTLYDL